MQKEGDAIVNIISTKLIIIGTRLMVVSFNGICDTPTRGSVNNPSTREIHVAIECLNATK